MFPMDFSKELMKAVASVLVDVQVIQGVCVTQNERRICGRNQVKHCGPFPVFFSLKLYRSVYMVRQRKPSYDLFQTIYYIPHTEYYHNIGLSFLFIRCLEAGTLRLT